MSCPWSLPPGRCCGDRPPGELASYLGLTVESLPERCFDLVVVGGGPAGLAAAVYGASEGFAHPRSGDDRAGWASGGELTDRELPRVSHGHLRYRTSPSAP